MTLFRTVMGIVGGLAGQRVASSLASRIEGSPERTEADDHETERTDGGSAEDATDDEANGKREAEETEDSSREFLARRVRDALTRSDGSDASENDALDIGSMSDEDLREFADQVVGELDRRSGDQADD